MSKRQFIQKSIFGFAGLSAFFCFKKMFGSEQGSFNYQNNDIDKLKHIKEAFFYSKLTDAVQCNLCPNGCILKEGEISICKNKVNYKGKLYTMAYGNPCTVNIDPIEKKPLYHFLPSSKIYSIATAGCNLSCKNCQNWTISQVGANETENYELFPKDVVENCLKSNCKSIAYTYAEPIAFYEYTYETAKIAKEQGIKNVLVSNGYINEKPLRELAKYLDAANINLKSFNENIYKNLNGGHLKPIQNTLLTLKEENVWLEITNLIIPEWTDNLDMIKQMCDWLYKNQLHEFPLHFSRFFPQYKLTQLPVTSVSLLEKAQKIALDSGIKYVYIGNVPNIESEDTFCPNCNNKIVDRQGFYINDIKIKNNKCVYCNNIISGVWI